MSSPGLAGTGPEATPEDVQKMVGEPLRECLIEMVDECLRHKGEGIDHENYFASVLDPLFRILASDCMEKSTEDPVEFVQEWVELKLKAPLGTSTGLPTELLAPLPCLKAWCDKQLRFKQRHRPAMDALQAEVAVLRRQLQMLQRGLGVTLDGQAILAAVAAEDQPAFDAAVTSSGLLRPAQAVDAYEMAGVAPEGSPSAMEAESSETMGEVLRELRLRGMMSASAAFQHFQPGDDGFILAARFSEEINRFENISPRRCHNLVRCLDRQVHGRIHYQDFRSKISSFLATSRDFHPSLSADELHAIMTRIRMKLQQQGLTVSEAFREWDAGGNANGILECAEFMSGLCSLNLGVSSKEAAQVFNAMTDKANPGRVSLQVFETSLQGGMNQNRLKDWALTSFRKLREKVELGAAEKCLRRYAEEPHCQHLHYSGFTALTNATEPSYTSTEIGKLWCVLHKVDGVEEPTVSVDELLTWMDPCHNSGGTGDP